MTEANDVYRSVSIYDVAGHPGVRITILRRDTVPTKPSLVAVIHGGTRAERDLASAELNARLKEAARPTIVFYDEDDVAPI